MFKDVKYAPQMSQRKLAKSNMTTITEANLGKVMGDFNRFFAHDNVYQLHGFQFEVVDQEEHVMPDGYKFTTDIEGDRQIPIYHPIPKVHCKIHSLWTDYLKKNLSIKIRMRFLGLQSLRSTKLTVILLRLVIDTRSSVTDWSSTRSGTSTSIILRGSVTPSISRFLRSIRRLICRCKSMVCMRA